MPLAEQIASGQLGLTGLVEVLLKLGLVLLLIYFTFFFVRRWSQSADPTLRIKDLLPSANRNSMINSLAIHRLTPNASLHLIEIDQRRFLISVTAQEVSLMLECTPLSERPCNENPLTS